MNPTALHFVSSYQRVYNQTYTAEHAQDLVQNMLHNNYPEKHPYGHRGTVVAEVVCEMLKLVNGAEIYTECLRCNVHNITISHEYVQIIEHTNRNDKTITDLLIVFFM